MNQNTWISWLTTGIGLIGMLAADRGVIDSSTATTIAGGAATMVPILWGLFIHRDSKVVQTAALVAGIAPIQVLPTAAPAIQELAADKNVPEVVPAAPTSFTPTAKRTY